MLFYTRTDSWNHKTNGVVDVVSTETGDLQGLCSTDISGVKLLLIYKNQHIFTIGDNGAINHYVYLSKDGFTPSHSLVMCRNFYGAMGDYNVSDRINGLALLAEGKIAAFSDTGEPFLYVLTHSFDGSLGQLQIGVEYLCGNCYRSYGIKYCLCPYKQYGKLK